MKYITSVRNQGEGHIEHIIESAGSTIKVIEKMNPEGYGDHKGQTIFIANGVNVGRDMHVNIASGYHHIAKIVLAVEQVRFVMQSTDQKIGARP